MRRARAGGLALVCGAWLAAIGCGGRVVSITDGAVGGISDGSSFAGASASRSGAGGIEAGNPPDGSGGRSGISGISGIGGAIEESGGGGAVGDSGAGGTSEVSAGGTAGSAGEVASVAAGAGGSAAQGGDDGATCGNGLLECGESCVDTKSDLSHCGSCNHACSVFSGAQTSCVGGICKLSCSAGYDCDGDVSNGCESNLTDSKNCGTCGKACAAPSCVQGQCEKLVFVSSEKYTGDLGGLAGGDSRCQTLAQAVGLPGQFKAWLSSETVSAASRLSHSTSRYLLIDGSVVADDWTDLTDNSIDHAINLTEFGSTPSETPGVVPSLCDEGPSARTGTYGGGQTAGSQTCNNWTLGASGLGDYGSTLETSSLWTGHCGGPCGVPMHLYCFEQ